jgi:general secretion pathway protein A
MEILETINHEFGIEMGSGAETKKDYIDALNQFLLENFSSGGNALLLLDEAQNLSHTVLEQIRMLSNLETEKDKLIQVVLVGQSELKGILAAPSLRQLNERITVRYDLKPLGPADLKGYVDHRLLVAGGSGNPSFTNSAFKKIYEYTSGNPRRINAVCDRALLIAYTGEKQTITRSMIKNAIRDLRGGAGPGQMLEGRSRSITPLTIILIILLMIIGGFAGWNLRSNILAVFSKTELSAPREAEKRPAIPDQNKKGLEDLFLDERSSLAGLFDLFRTKTGSLSGEEGKERLNTDDFDLGLVSFNVAPEYFTLFKKPFRVKLSGVLPLSVPRPCYLLIDEVTYNSVIAIDGEGNRRPVSRDFILEHWGGTVSAVYPYGESVTYLGSGMDSPEVLEIQRVLDSIGYPVEPNGVFDEQTSREVIRFQRDFGLNEDGIVGRRTMALLFQMTE